MALSEERRAQIAQALASKGSLGLCPLCRSRVSVLDSYAAVYLPDSLEEVDIGETPMLTAAATACGQCGFLMLHDLRRLGLGS